MIYIENTYICLAAPLFLAILLVKKNWKRSLAFMLFGMTSCLLSSYVTTFFARLLEADMTSASYQIAPAVEEVIKFLPVLLYLLLFEPEKKNAVNGIIVVAVGFATFENVIFITQNGTSDLFKLLIRGFGTGAMHVLCAMMISVGMFLLWDHTWLRMVGTFAVLCVAVTAHAIFNITVAQPGISLLVGAAIPLLLILIFIHVGREIFDRTI